MRSTTTQILLLLITFTLLSPGYQALKLKDEKPKPKPKPDLLRPADLEFNFRIREKNLKKSLWLKKKDKGFQTRDKTINMKFKKEDGTFDESVIMSFSFEGLLKKEEMPKVCQTKFEEKKFGANWVIATPKDSKCEYGQFPDVENFVTKTAETTAPDGFLVGFGGQQNFLRLIPKIPGAAEGEQVKFVTYEKEGKRINTLFIQFENTSMKNFEEKIEDNFVYDSRNFDKTVFVKFNKYFRLAVEPLIKKTFKVETEGDEVKEITVSFKYGKKLTKDEIPEYESCKDVQPDEFNYIIATKKNCVSAMNNVYKKIDYKDDIAELHLNWIEKEDFILLLKPREKITNNLDFERIVPAKEKDKAQLPIKNLLSVYINKDDLKEETKTQEERYMRWSISLTISVIPAFAILFFNSNFNYNGFYVMQFGIVFNFVSQITLAIIEWFGLEDLYVAQLLIIILSMLLAMYYCQDRMESLIKVWILFSIVDYSLMAMLMNTSGTFFYGLINVLFFFLLVYLIRMEKSSIPNNEIAISFALSLTMLTLLGNLWYFTTCFNRVYYIFRGFRVHDKKPGLYYMVYGIMFSVISLARLILNEVLPWNKLASYRPPSKVKRDLEEGFMDKGEDDEDDLRNTAEERS